MKIHTTQNLNSLGANQSTNKVNIPSEIRLNYLDKLRKQRINEMPDTYESSYNSVSFKGKKEIIKKIINKSGKVADKEKWYDKLLRSGFFDKVLDMMSHEVVVQAVISAVICIFLRPLSIMLLPTKSKQDNMYASSHSIASGIVGVASAIIITSPFSKGIKYAQKNLIKDFSTDILKRKYPNLDINSIWKDASKTIRKPVEEWKDIYGNVFDREYKNVLKVARPKHISEVSEETLKTLGADIDMNAMKGKSVNEWTDKNGNKIKIPLKDMYIAVKEEGMGGSLKDYKDTNFFSLQHIDKDFLKEIMPDLDIASIEKDGKRLDTEFWKKTDGTPYNFDMDMVHISSYRETAHAIPLYTGLKRGAKSDKYLSYQKNNGIKDTLTTPEKLGSPIEQKTLDADATNEISNKILGWIPDIITRIPVAAGTVVLIPIILKRVFKLEKHKNTPAQQPQQQEISAKEAELSGKEAA